MKFHSHHHIHVNRATDRTQGFFFKHLSRVAMIGLAVLISLPIFTPTASALSVTDTLSAEIDRPIQVAQIQLSADEIHNLIPTLHTNRPFALTQKRASTAGKDLIHKTEELSSESFVTEENSIPTKEDFVHGVDSLPDANTPLTQELIARSIQPKLDTQARAGTKISYPYPAGAMAVTLYKDGKQILKGQVADIGGTVYVPVQRFADLFGNFKTVYTEATEQVVITGTNLSITVKVGDPYITVNERIFYTGKNVLSLGGWIFVPLTSMCKALDAKVTIRSGYYDAFITSGDPTSVAWASEYYNSTDLYWLSRIISAEAKGEPFAGQIAVGNVVLNRMRSSQFPNTIKGVIFDTKYGTQFSPVASGTIYNTPTASAIRAAKICLEGYSLSTTIIYFYNPSIATSSWIGRTRPYIMTIGNHKFYS